MKLRDKVLCAAGFITLLIASSGVAFSAATGIAGDLDEDGDVDAADLFLIQTGGTIENQQDWVYNYGADCCYFGGYPSSTTAVAVDVSLNVFPTDLGAPDAGGSWTLVAKTDSSFGIAAIAAVMSGVENSLFPDSITLATDINALDPISEFQTNYLVDNSNNTEVLYTQNIFSGSVLLGVGLAPSSDGPDPLGDPLWDDATEIAYGTYPSAVPSILDVGSTVFNTDTAQFTVDIATSSSVVRVEMSEDEHGDFDDDGDIDGDDFLGWQRGDVTNPPEAVQLAHWQATFGTVEAATATPFSVPEPASLLLLLQVGCFVSGIRLRANTAEVN